MTTPRTRRPMRPMLSFSRALALGVALLLGGATATTAAQDLVVRGGTVHTMAGEPITDGVVVVRDGLITAVGPAADVALPDGVRVVEAAVVTPGIVDARATVGLTGTYNQPHDQDQLETSAPVQPELRAVDSYNGREELVDWLRSFGITTVHTGHAPGAVVSGQTMVVKTGHGTVEDGLLEESAMVACTLGDGARAEDGPPGTRAKAVALLRQALVDAQEYRARRAGPEDQRPARDLRKETMARCLDGELPLLVTAHRHHDILAALRLGEEFGVPIVLDGAAEAHTLVDRIRAAGVPVIVHPTSFRQSSAEGETANITFENAAILDAAGIPIAQQSGFEDYVPKVRVVLLEAALSARYGLPFDRALRSITLGAAELVGVADRVGSLEVGKHGDLALYDGDPFEYASHCVGTVIEGELVFEGRR